MVPGATGNSGPIAVDTQGLAATLPPLGARFHRALIFLREIESGLKRAEVPRPVRPPIRNKAECQFTGNAVVPTAVFGLSPKTLAAHRSLQCARIEYREDWPARRQPERSGRSRSPQPNESGPQFTDSFLRRLRPKCFPSRLVPPRGLIQFDWRVGRRLFSLLGRARICFAWLVGRFPFELA